MGPRPKRHWPLTSSKTSNKTNFESRGVMCFHCSQPPSLPTELRTKATPFPGTTSQVSSPASLPCPPCPGHAVPPCYLSKPAPSDTNAILSVISRLSSPLSPHLFGRPSLREVFSVLILSPLLYVNSHLNFRYFIILLFLNYFSSMQCPYAALGAWCTYTSVTYHSG